MGPENILSLFLCLHGGWKLVQRLLQALNRSGVLKDQETSSQSFPGLRS